jgi:hypothetical protein
MAIWVFIVIFGAIFHHRDLSGAAKAGSCLLIFVIPFHWAPGHHHHCRPACCRRWEHSVTIGPPTIPG